MKNYNLFIIYSRSLKLYFEAIIIKYLIVSIFYYRKSFDFGGFAKQNYIYKGLRKYNISFINSKRCFFSIMIFSINLLVKYNLPFRTFFYTENP